MACWGCLALKKPVVRNSKWCLPMEREHLRTYRHTNTDYLQGFNSGEGLHDFESCSENMTGDGEDKCFNHLYSNRKMF